MMENKNIEYRSADIVIDSEKNMFVIGYAMTFDSPTVLYRDKSSGAEYKEVICKGALDGSDLSDVVMRYNHNDDCQILARVSNNTLSCAVDNKGLKIMANIADTTQGKDVYKLIQRKDVNKMSTAFIVDKQYFDAQTRTRYIQHIRKLYDVSAVDQPAYNDTSIDIVKRSFTALENGISQDEEKRKRLYINSKL